MAAYQAFTSTRTTRPDALGLLAALRTAVAPEVGITTVDDSQQHYTLKKSTPWLAADITAAQSTLDTFAAATPELLAQHDVDALPIATKAIVLALIDQLNVIRAALPAPLGAITPAQALAAVRTKAGTL